MHPPPFVPRRSRLVFYPSPVAPAYFWLVVASFELVGSHLRPRRVFFCFFYSFNSTPGSGRQHPPTRSALVASPLRRRPQCRSQLLFDCCVPLLYGSHHSGGAPFLSLFFCSQLAAPNEGQPSSPPRSASVAGPPHHLFQRRRRLLFDCCVF